MRGYRLRQDDLIRRAVISRLLCHTVVPKAEIEREFGVPFDDYFAPELARLEEVAADGLVLLSPAEICATLLGRIFIRNVAMVFDPYLKEQGAGRPLFSRRSDPGPWNGTSDTSARNVSCRVANVARPAVINSAERYLPLKK